VDDWHTYYVSDSEVFVHNMCAVNTGAVGGKPSNVLDVNPKEVNFCQNSVNKKFDTPNGKISMQKAVRQGAEQVENFPPIKVANVKGQYVAIDGNNDMTN